MEKKNTPKTPEIRDSVSDLVCHICKLQEHCTGNSDFECILVQNFFYFHSVLDGGNK